MRLKNYITELFTTKVDVKITNQDRDYFTVLFDVGDYNYEFQAQVITPPDWEREVWAISFRRIDVMGMPEYALTKDLDTKEVMTVFSGVKKSGELFLRKYKPDIFVFSAWKKEPKRIQVYKDLIKYINKWFPQYKYNPNYEGDENEVTFAWVKK